MELSRRDALAALAAGGASLAGCTVDAPTARDGPSTRTIDTLVAVAETIYPSPVSGVADFVEAYARGRAADRPEHADRVADAAAELDAHAREWYGAAYAELDRDARDRLLRELGCDTADEVPDGTTAERLRYYLVNELLYALYTSPKGGELVGIENPQGHPGGITSYRHR